MTTHVSNLDLIMGGPTRPEKVRVWVPKYGPMGGFGQKISGPNFFGTGLGLTFGPRSGPARPEKE